MEQIQDNPFARSPTLETILMVERTIEAHSGKFNRTDLWKALPKKVMWQTYLVVIHYLEQSNKILVDKDEKIVWIWNPSLIRHLESEGLIKK